HDLVGPGAVGQVDRDLVQERDVLADRHPGWLLRVDHVALLTSFSSGCAWCSACTADSATRTADSGPAAARKEEGVTHGAKYASLSCPVKDRVRTLVTVTLVPIGANVTVTLVPIGANVTRWCLSVAG